MELKGIPEKWDLIIIGGGITGAGVEEARLEEERAGRDENRRCYEAQLPPPSHGPECTSPSTSWSVRSVMASLTSSVPSAVEV